MPRTVTVQFITTSQLGHLVAASPQSPSAPKFPHPDHLGSATWWLAQVQDQATHSQEHQYRGCLFGDSISAALGKQLGEGMVNFSLGGLSSVSLVAQLKILKAAQIRCQTVVLAVGTNDAWYQIQDQVYVKTLRQGIAWVRSLGATQITLVPAFYSTLAASRDPSVAGSIERVDQINQLMSQVAQVEQVGIATTGLEALFDGNSLNPDLTFDGVHLNARGRDIYRPFLMNLFERHENLSGLWK